jgi:hypothetical protein
VHVTVPETRGGSQLRLLTAISVFGDSTPPFFVSKNETFEQKRSVDFEIHEEHDCTTRTAPKTFMTQV